MKQYSLTTKNGFINPHWYNSVKGHKFESIVDFNEEIIIEGCVLKFTYKNEKLPINSKVIVFINNNFYCTLKSEYDDYLLKQRQIIEEKEKQRKLKLNNRRKEAENFNQSIKLPVKWDVGRKDVLSGLSANSWGDGYRSNTVEHIYLLEDLNIGKFHRNQYDFLCTSKSGNNGKNWSGRIISKYIDGDNNEYQPKVTCKACLKILEKLLKK